MAYENYKKLLSITEYFADWKKKNLDLLSPLLQKAIYDKYKVKRAMLIRDNFTCQNNNCKYCHNVRYFTNLTKHHVKFKKNKGHDKARNLVTVCKNAHNAYHNAKTTLIFVNHSLPPHIKGHTFKLQKPDKVNWKELIQKGKKIRKKLKAQGFKPIIDWDKFYLLLRWVFIPFDEMDDD